MDHSKQFRLHATVFALVTFASFAKLASAVVLGQVDTFQDGTVMLWTGAPGYQSNVATGGPAGAGDRYMRVTSDGGPFSGGKMAMYNTTQWSGNYNAAGVKVVTVHFRNEGATNLTMRLVLFDVFALTQWVSTVSQAVPPDGVWRKYTYILVESAMTRTAGAESFANTMGNCNRMMFRHESGPPSNGGQSIVAQLGIDNVSALAGVSVSPSAVFIDAGLLSGGGLPEIQASDNQYLNVGNDDFDPIATVRCEGTSPLASASALTLELETGNSRDDQNVLLELFNNSTQMYEVVFAPLSQFPDTLFSVRITSNPNRFIGPGGLVRARFQWFPINERSDFDGWGQRIDLVRWVVEP